MKLIVYGACMRIYAGVMLLFVWRTILIKLTSNFLVLYVVFSTYEHRIACAHFFRRLSLKPATCVCVSCVTSCKILAFLKQTVGIFRCARIAPEREMFSQNGNVWLKRFANWNVRVQLNEWHKIKKRENNLLWFFLWWRCSGKCERKETLKWSVLMPSKWLWKSNDLHH